MTNISRNKVLRAIQGTGGIISQVANKLGVEWHTAKKYIQKWASTRKAFKAEREKVLDLAESVIVENIQKKNVSDAKWILTRLGKERGYVTQQNVDVTSKGERITSEIDWSKYSREQLKEIERILNEPAQDTDESGD